MDTSFHDDIPFFSPATKELLPEGSAKENISLVDYVSPLLYPESAYGAGTESLSPKGGQQL